MCEGMLAAASLARAGSFSDMSFLRASSLSSSTLLRALAAAFLAGCGGTAAPQPVEPDAGVATSAPDAGVADGGVAVTPPDAGPRGPTTASPIFITMHLGAGSLPPSPTNIHATDPGAAALGQSLFFDSRMSSDGKVSCATCHDAAQGFSDARQVSLGINGLAGKRHSPSAATAALMPFLFWDGRADSAWSQPLKAIEGAVEMNFSRVEVARLVLDRYLGSSQAIIGAPPDLGVLPLRAMPGMAEWEALTDGQRDGVQRMFANAGKALEAYERKLTCADTKFDRWTHGDVQLTATEETGAAAFVSNKC